MRPVTLLFLLAAATAAALPASGQPASEQRPGEIFGTLLAPRTPLAVPPDAVLTLRVVYEQDGSETEVPGTEVLAERTVPTAGRQFPLTFSLPYDASRVRAYSGYVLHADVHDAAGRLLWSNTLSPPIPPGIMFAPGMASTWGMDVYGEVPPAVSEPVSDPEPVGIVMAPPSAGAAPRTRTPAASTPEPSDMIWLAMNRWRLTELVPAEGQPVRGDAAAPVTLTFRPRQLVSGTMACSSFHGTYEVDDSGRLVLGPRTASLTRCAETPTDAAVERVLATVTRASATWSTLVLAGDAGTLTFARIDDDLDMEKGMDGDVSEYACGAAGTARLRIGDGDAQLWLSDPLAARPAGTSRAGIYHVLAQVPAVHGARYADGPLSIDTDGTGLLADVESNSRKVLKHGQRANVIVGQMMDHARSAPSTSTTHRRVDVNALVREQVALEMEGRRTGRPEWTCRVVEDLGAETGAVTASSPEIARVVQSLLRNALDALDEREASETGSYEPVLRAQTRRGGGAVSVAVSDNGSGLAAALRQRVFEPFYTTRPPGSGHPGLGLSLAHETVVGRYGGQIDVESEEGVGSTFTVRLPAA